jgi:hypothetical protein
MAITVNDILALRVLLTADSPGGWEDSRNTLAKQLHANLKLDRRLYRPFLLYLERGT